MPPLQLPPGSACRVVLATGTPRAQLNPVYRTLAAQAAAAPDSPALEQWDLELLRGHVTAPVVLALAASVHDGRTYRLRIALHADGASVERDGGQEWGRREPAELPGLIAELLPTGSVLAAPPRLTQQHPGKELRLTSSQSEQLRARIAHGDEVSVAVRAMPGLDPRLRDALLARGDRVSLSLTLHGADRGSAHRRRADRCSAPWNGADRDGAPRGRAGPVPLETPVAFGRLWSVGELGLYRTDRDGSPPGTVLPVEPGDVLGTILPLLAEGARFAADRAGVAR